MNVNKRKRKDNYFSFVLVIDRFCVGIDDVYSFRSTFMNELMFKGARKMVAWALDRNVDSFSKKMLLIPFSFNGHQSLPVVVDASIQLNGRSGG